MNRRDVVEFYHFSFTTFGARREALEVFQGDVGAKGNSKYRDQRPEVRASEKIRGQSSRRKGSELSGTLVQREIIISSVTLISFVWSV